VDIKLDFSVASLGERKVPSPMGLSNRLDDGLADYTRDEDRVVYDRSGASPELFFERAGPRELNYFRGEDVTAGIVTCGGLCPGMNNVIRELVRRLWFRYGVRRILGFRYGFLGMTAASPDKPLPLDPDVIHDIHRQGGTMLGSSRGPQKAEDMAEFLDEKGVNVLFAVGGDGTMRGTLALYQEVRRRGLKIAVVGVPKTVDNDVRFIERTFGFDTAVAVATSAIDAARVEATGASHGIGLVRLMGRHSGFIAASAAIASREANLLLVPELPFDLHGEKGVLQYLRWRLATRGHALVIVAEGAGQSYLQAAAGKDASGNVKLGDIGIFMRDTLARELSDLDVTVKYIDPSYMVRAAPANAADAIFCGQLAECAVHAAMAGKTGLVLGYWLGHFTHVPLSVVTTGRKVISLDSSFWRYALEATGQPMVFTGGAPR
jgi:6-phosphofructokinase 1